MRTVTPLSSPGDNAFVITFKQCIHRTQSLLSTLRVLSSFNDKALVGHLVITLSMTYLRPFFSTKFLTSTWSTFISSAHVPMIAISARSILFMQSLGQPETLNLNLYGRAGLCISSKNSLTRSLWIFCSLQFDISQRAPPTHDIPVRTAGPAPPISKPISFSALKHFWTLSWWMPWNMMSPDWPWKAIRPEPPVSVQVSHNCLSTLVV